MEWPLCKVESPFHSRSSLHILIAQSSSSILKLFITNIPSLNFSFLPSLFLFRALSLALFPSLSEGIPSLPYHSSIVFRIFSPYSRTSLWMSFFSILLPPVSNLYAGLYGLALRPRNSVKRCEDVTAFHGHSQSRKIIPSTMPLTSHVGPTLLSTLPRLFSRSMASRRLLQRRNPQKPRVQRSPRKPNPSQSDAVLL